MRLIQPLFAAVLLAVPASAFSTEEVPAFVITENQRAANQSLLWGTYRPQVFFGVKPRLPKSLLAGLMWMKVDDYTNPMRRKWDILGERSGTDGFRVTAYMRADG